LIGHDLPDHTLHREIRERLVEAKPTEEMQLEVTNEQILRHIANLSSQINGVPAHFV
jgi:FKBP-type peptidyl-prolyl cis-trans isomerase (trigger factor)